MTTPFQKEVKKALNESTTVFPDRVVCRKNGTVEVQRNFFYTHGQTAEKWAEEVLSVLPDAHQVTCDMVWKDWPKTSYFTVTVEPKEA